MDDIPAGEGVNTGPEPVVVQQELCESLVGIIYHSMRQLQSLSTVYSAQGQMVEC